MTGLFVTVCIILAIFLLLLAPIRLHFVFRDGKLQLHLYYLVFKIDFSPETISLKADRKGKKTKKPKKAKKPAAPSAEGKKAGSIPTFRMILSLLSGSRKSLNRIRRNLIFYKVDIQGRISAGDPHKAALSYSYATSMAAVLLSIISELFVLHTYQVRLVPDFTRDTSWWNISFRIRIMPLALIRGAVSIGVSVIKVIRQLKQDEAPTNQRKGGQIHEPATSHQ